MKNKFLFLFVLLSSVKTYSQKDTLFSSISYYKTLHNNNHGKVFRVNTTLGYPGDLSTANLFYIEINDSDIYLNKGKMGLSYQKINKTITSKMSKLYPYNFKTLSNDFRSKGKDYFIKEGYKYRLLINSTWYTVGTDESQAEYKQNFAIAIQDISTGIIYGTEDWYWYYNYIKKFIKTIKK